MELVLAAVYIEPCEVGKGF